MARFPTAPIVKDPDAVLDYTFDWSEWLADADADTIDSHTVTAQSGITKDSDSSTDTVVTVWLSGGTVGAVYSITCHIVTAAGREDDRTIRIQVTQR